MNAKIADYQIITKSDEADLSDIVRDLIVKGWQPQGGVAIKVVTGSNYSFSQAMVRFTA